MSYDHILFMLPKTPEINISSSVLTRMAQAGQDDESSNPAVPVTPALAGIPTRNNDAALFVGGLSFSASEEDLRQAFGYIGTILSVRIVQDRDTGKPRGFAFVNFEGPECVDTAIRDCQGMELCGRHVRLDRSAAGIFGRGKGKGGSHHFVPYHPTADYGMYPSNYRGNLYPVSHFGPMYPAVPYGFAAPPPPTAGSASSPSVSGDNHQEGLNTGGHPPPPPPPPQYMFHPMVGHGYHPMLGMAAYPSQTPAPPAPPAPPSTNAE